VEHQVDCAVQRLSPLLSSRVSFEVGDITNLKHEDGAFDLVLDEVCLSHLRGEYAFMMKPAAKELRRVAKTGGIVVVSGYIRETKADDLDELLNDICGEGRFTEMHRRDITEQCGAGAIAAIEHMFGEGALSRIEELFCLVTQGAEGFEDCDWGRQVFLPDKQLNQFGLVGKICATLCDPARFAAIVQELKTLGQEATGLPDMPVNIHTTGAVPAEHMVTYGMMLDMTLMGCLTVLKRCQQLEEDRKRCYVVTLKATEN